MRKSLSKEVFNQLFTEARSHHHWTKKPVRDEDLKSLYEIIKYGPTSGNLQPARIVFVRSEEGKRKLYPALEGMGSNLGQVQSAPVTAIIAQDPLFWKEAPRLFPRMDVKGMFENDVAFAESIAYRSSSLTGAYLMIAARGMGLDVCPMSGFHNDIIDETFFKENSWKTNFICTIGYGDDSRLYSRDPRLTFDKACRFE
ncbi:malonic semialdehyde reductase [Chryseobacterium daecheongense]|uniref:3-hydroxypropanoate dehydrogenase n=1 Tax=Chryseobacterium daecheongense TaxID=192389 RepID=A0A3N0VYM8_9FLAO|nr:malonic semialdehyde reductase [Chryseobacterium daecheongense]ROH97837.1 malonic semialdehyde reductase [Chryseobacterium daecheongense]TDX92990.1 3-hydroxypropanoate dehydrogenase [Chryseobacterium daecheongense]